MHEFTRKRLTAALRSAEAQVEAIREDITTAQYRVAAAQEAYSEALAFRDDLAALLASEETN